MYTQTHYCFECHSFLNSKLARVMIEFYPGELFIFLKLSNEWGNLTNFIENVAKLTDDDELIKNGQGKIYGLYEQVKTVEENIEPKALFFNNFLC